MTTAHLYIAACLIVAGLDVYIGLKVWDMYFSQSDKSNLSASQDEDDQEGDDQEGDDQ